MNDFAVYLLEVLLATAMLSFSYRLFFAKLTFFAWNRWFLLAGVATALILPTIPFSYLFSGTFFNPASTFNTGWLINQGSVGKAQNHVLVSNVGVSNQVLLSEGLGRIFRGIYMTGIAYMAYRFIKSLCFVVKLRRSARLVEASNNYKIYVQDILPTFSFGTCIYLHSGTKNLSKFELDLIVRHELTHVKLKHTWDVLILEITCIFFWFNPFFYYLSKCLRAVHEFQADADAHVAGRTNYGKLIIKLASTKRAVSFIHTFSDSSIFSRIKMLTKPKSSSMQKLRFLCMLPLAAMIMIVCSCLKEGRGDQTEIAAKSVDKAQVEVSGLKIGKVTWKGNTKYSGDELNEALGMRTGEVYDSLKIDEALFSRKRNVVGLYMDEGYLFFRVEPSIKVTGKVVDLAFEIFEGPIVKIGKVTFSGVKKLNAIELTEKVETKPGDLFSRAKLINSQRILAELGAFDAKNINVNPIPDWSSKTNGVADKVDIEFVVKEI